MSWGLKLVSVPICWGQVLKDYIRAADANETLYAQPPKKVVARDPI